MRNQNLRVVYDGSRGQSLTGAAIDVSHYDRKECGEKCPCRLATFDDRGLPLRETRYGPEAWRGQFVHPDADDVLIGFDLSSGHLPGVFWSKASDVFVLRTMEARRRGYARLDDIPAHERWWD